MTVLFRTFIVWLVLLALPYQGYASAAMMLCVPANAAAEAGISHIMDMSAMPDGPHDHAAMMAAMAQDHQHDDNASHAGHGHGGGVKCGGSACCVAGAPALTTMVSVPSLAAVSGPIPFHSEFLPAVDLAHPERPPQA